jgi:hypothetical protein
MRHLFRLFSSCRSNEMEGIHLEEHCLQSSRTKDAVWKQVEPRLGGLGSEERVSNE